MNVDFITLANEGVQKLTPYQPGKPVEELERELGISNIIKLASNENPLGPSKIVVNAITEHLAQLGRYPDGSGFRLTQRLSDHLDVDKEKITLGNGSNDVLQMLMQAFVNPSHEVIYSEHAFAIYPLLTLTMNAKPIMVKANQFGHDLSLMLKHINQRTRVIFIANPNNPTGTWIKKSQLEPFLAQVPKTVLVVLDEAYHEYVDQQEYPDGLQFIDQYPNLVVTRTFSKIYGLAALRVGYSVSHPMIANVLNRVRQPFNVNSLAQVAAYAALDDDAFVKNSKQLNDQGLIQLSQGFEQLGLDYIPSIGNFISVDVNQDALGVYQQLLHQGVIVRPVAAYGMPNHLRVSVGLEAENKRCLEAFKTVLN